MSVVEMRDHLAEGDLVEVTEDVRLEGGALLRRGQVARVFFVEGGYAGISWHVPGEGSLSSHSMAIQTAKLLRLPVL